MKKIIFLFVAAFAFVATFFLTRTTLEQRFFAPRETGFEIGVERPRAQDIKIVAENLDIPWEIQFLPSGEMLVTERSGVLLKIGTGKTRIPIAGVEHVGEGGLLGLALHPNFAKNNLLYLYLTTRTDAGLINRVERYRLAGDELLEQTTILDNIPGARFHDGGRIAFGPDRYLYITTGDAGNENSAQDKSALSGKILRLKDDGSVPADNPFGTAVYSFGHRNAQGLAWDGEGNLWATEHGRSGLRSGFDELNKIKKGQNYGWPVIEGDEVRSGMHTPEAHSGADETWAPAGALYYEGHILFVGLRGEAVYEAHIEAGEVESLRAHLRGEFGRLRVITKGPDGYLYITTSNQDGRGSVQEGDDKIIRLHPDIFSAGK